MATKQLAPSKSDIAKAEKAAAKSNGLTHKERLWLSRGVPLAAPWFAFIVEAIAIPYLHDWATQDTVRVALVPVGIFAVGAVLTTYTFIAAGPRKHLRVIAPLSGAVATLLLVVGTSIGLAPWWVVYALICITIGGIWDIRHLMKWADEPSLYKGGRGGLAALGDAVEDERWNWSQAQKSGKGIVTATVTAGEAGIEELKDLKTRMEEAGRVPMDGVTIRRDHDDAGKATVEIKVANLLKGTIPWPGPHRVGACVSCEIPIGLYDTREVVEIYAVGKTEEIDLEHLLVMGVSGAGKSFFGRIVVTNLLCRKRVNVVVIDTKGTQTFGCVAHGLDMLITDYAKARKFIAACSKSLIKERTDRLAEEGLDRWSPWLPLSRTGGKKIASSLNLVVVWIEEAADMFPSKEAYKEFVRKARSAGVLIVSSLQRATHDNLDTDARANHGSGMCFGVREAADASFVLPPEVEVTPTWRASKPGHAYLAGWGTDPDQWSRELKIYLAKKSDLAAAVTAAADVRDPVDDIFRKVLGTIYDNRTIYLKPVGVDIPDPLPAAEDLAPTEQPRELAMAGAPAVSSAAAAGASSPAPLQPSAISLPPSAHTRSTPAVPERLGARDVMTEADALRAGPDDPDGFRMELDDDEDVHSMELNANRELADAQDDMVDEFAQIAERELAGVPDEDLRAVEGLSEKDEIQRSDDIELDFDADDPEVVMTPERRKARLNDLLHGWLHGGKDEFEVNDLNELLEAVGRSRQWFYRIRDQYIEAGVLSSSTDEYGTYDILRDPLDIWPAQTESALGAGE